MSLSHCQLAFQQRIKHHINLPNCPLFPQPTKGTKPSCSTRQQKLPTNCLYYCRNESQEPRVFAVSDLHTDYSENMRWVKGLSTSWYQNDVLIVDGDVAETYSNFLVTMSELKDRFGFIFFVPGNHDLWCRREGDKFEQDVYVRIWCYA